MNNPAASCEVSTPNSNPQAVRLPYAASCEEFDPKRFNSADKAGELVVFDVGAGYRIIGAVHFNRNKIYLRHVFTHAEL